MTYEEKFELIIKAIAEAQKFARKEYYPKLYYNEESGLKDVDLNQIHDILLQLQDDEKIITVKSIPTPLKSAMEQATEGLEGAKHYFTVDIADTFNSWYQRHILNNKSRLQNIDYINLLKIYDVVLDIDEKLQIKASPDVYIPALPTMVRFQILFPMDSIGTRDKYRTHRQDGLDYLEREGYISDVEWVDDMYYGNFAMKVNVARFQDFLKEIMAEYKRRNKAVAKAEAPAKKVEKKDAPQPQKTIKIDVRYEVVFSKQREIMVNGIVIARPDFNSENEVVFWFLYENPNKKHTRQDIEKVIGRQLTKTLHKIIENLGFRNDFRKAFFDVSKNSILFRNPLKQEDLEALGIQQLKFPKGK